jgi:hypothetical protein
VNKLLARMRQQDAAAEVAFEHVNAALEMAHAALKAGSAEDRARAAAHVAEVTARFHAAHGSSPLSEFASAAAPRVTR